MATVDMFFYMAVFLLVITIIYFVAPIVTGWADEAEKGGAYKRKKN
jgi:quinol-cytochrome oxidoreductase complex cytochrome b subunit